jgi:hypothetical protein
MPAAVPFYRLDSLRIEPRMLGEGGAADIYVCRTTDGDSMVFKRYNVEAREDLDVAALRHLIEWPARLSDEDRRRLMRICAWPQGVVVDDGVAIGILMAPAPQQFFFQDHRSHQLKPCHLELLGVREELAKKRQWPYFDFPHKIARLGHLLEDLQFLHSHGIVVGDLQIKNILTTNPEPDTFGITTTEILLLDCDSFIVDGQAALPPMDPPNMQFRHPVDGPSATTDLYKFALVVIRCLSETLSADSINYDKFSQILPSSSFAIIEKLLAEPNPGLTAADLGNMAKAWQATAKKDGRLYCRTDTSLWEKWTQEKRKAHLAGIASPQSPQAQPADNGRSKTAQPKPAGTKPSEPTQSKPGVSKPPRPPQSKPAGGASESRQAEQPPYGYQFIEPDETLPRAERKGVPHFILAGGLVLVTIATIAIGLTIVHIIGAQHSETASSTYTTTAVETTVSVVTATAGSVSAPPTQSGNIIRNARLGDCIIMTTGAARPGGLFDAIVQRSTCNVQSATSYQVIGVVHDQSSCSARMTTWVDDTSETPRVVLCLVNN